MYATKPFKGVIHIKAVNQYQLTSAFMRLQEYYESPFDEIRGHYFTVEQYMDRYAEETGNFTYTTDWNGFNVPGHVVDNFFETFDDLLDKENHLHELISANVETPAYYVIGTWNADTIDHELAHAFWYLDDDYRHKAVELILSLTPWFVKQIDKGLKDLGYHDEMICDETNAYLSTSMANYLIDRFHLENANDLPWTDIIKFQNLFEETKKRLME